MSLDRKWSIKRSTDTPEWNTNDVNAFDAGNSRSRNFSSHLQIHNFFCYFSLHTLLLLFVHLLVMYTVQMKPIEEARKRKKRKNLKFKTNRNQWNVKTQSKRYGWMREIQTIVEFLWMFNKIVFLSHFHLCTRNENVTLQILVVCYNNNV